LTVGGNSLDWAVAHPRDGLRESLEAYAERAGVEPASARLAWRMWGALALGLPAPGAPCPTWPGGPEVVIEDSGEYPPPWLLAGQPLTPVAAEGWPL
jgi:hypothetical protein